MELAELLEREGLDPDELMTWARTRADALVAGLAPDEQGEPLLRLLVADATIDVGAVSAVAAAPEVKRVEVASKPVPFTPVRETSGLQPIMVSPLPPPPEPQLAQGEPEPILETFDTGPIDLGTPEADALLAASVAPEKEEEPAEQAEAPAEAEPQAEDELEEIELDELVEIAEEELEVLDELDEPEDPLPPRRPSPEAAPIRTGATESFPVVDEAPVRTGDTAAHMVIQAAGDDELEDVDLDAPRAPEGDEDFDLDLEGD